MGFWSDLGDAVQEGMGNYLTKEEMDRILGLSRNVARRELRHYVEGYSEEGIQRVVSALDDIARDEDDERADLAAELAEYAESLID